MTVQAAVTKWLQRDRARRQKTVTDNAVQRSYGTVQGSAGVSPINQDGTLTVQVDGETDPTGSPVTVDLPWLDHIAAPSAGDHVVVEKSRGEWLVTGRAYLGGTK